MENIPESLRLYAFCKAIRFGALPVAGGLYDQHPKLLAEWEVIMDEENQAEKRQQARENAKNRSKGGRR